MDINKNILSVIVLGAILITVASLIFGTYLSSYLVSTETAQIYAALLFLSSFAIGILMGYLTNTSNQGIIASLIVGVIGIISLILLFGALRPIIPIAIILVPSVIGAFLCGNIKSKANTNNKKVRKK